VSVVRGAVSRCSGVVEVVAGRVERFRRREERTQLVARLQATSLHQLIMYSMRCTLSDATWQIRWTDFFAMVAVQPYATITVATF